MPASALMNVMLAAARKAGRSLARDFGEVEQLQVSLKGPANFVSAADTRAEEILYTELIRARPGYGFLMEERGEVEGADRTHRWIVDPLDGTTNFLHGIPHFAISIALERDGELVAGLIFNPANQETFTAERGKGAYLNDRRRLRVAARTELSASVIGTGIPHSGRPDARSLPQGAPAPSWRHPPGCGAWAPLRSTWPGPRPAGSTASGSAICGPGTSPPASSSCARQAAM